MNLDSIHRLIAEAQIFQMQQSSLKSPCDSVVPASPRRETCHSYLPLYGLQSHATQNVCAHSHSTNEWDISEELRLRELEEVKARAAQMEKTMRWWSDCTANWREKWSKVRAERNSAREEGRQLRIRLEMALKELSTLKKKQRLPHEKEALEVKVTQDLERPYFLEAYAQEEQFQVRSQTRECLVKNQSSAKENTNSKEEGVIIDPLGLNENMKLNLDFSDLFNNGGSGNFATKPKLRPHAINPPLESEAPEMSALQVPSDDLKKVLWKEREIRSSLEKEIEQLESALSLWKWKYEELRELKLKNPKEISLFHGQHENEVEGKSKDVKEGPKSQNSKDREIHELRRELERLQAENTSEWDQREMLETEKQGLERENRRLKVQELLEVQHAYYKLNKQYQARRAELTHANNQVDQNEGEVKKLRFQVEELKRGLNQKEDELGDSLKQIHKLQTSLGEQKEINENLETELKHLQSRIEQQQRCLFKVKLSTENTCGDSMKTENEEEARLTKEKKTEYSKY
ncbi:coiled-coil domain-containing protein 102B isoform X2 [Elephas maximus indicus]|uniref:coiled-coil domain-containing protein 102B isoform X2 n=1 Tax=Elephas maximus indicus TaxID=99487 RepID=UPI0021165C00|nr:coiled-coil domain-containing protein 102B isoform X2 [Elephas maximus indicus]